MVQTSGKHNTYIYSSVSRLLVLSGFSPDFTHLENTSRAIELYNEKKRRGKKLTLYPRCCVVLQE
jgi:hypothetical protein